jgi:hypothetical protein
MTWPVSFFDNFPKMNEFLIYKHSFCPIIPYFRVNISFLNVSEDAFQSQFWEKYLFIYSLQVILLQSLLTISKLRRFNADFILLTGRNFIFIIVNVLKYFTVAMKTAQEIDTKTSSLHLLP